MPSVIYNSELVEYKFDQLYISRVRVTGKWFFVICYILLVCDNISCALSYESVSSKYLQYKAIFDLITTNKHIAHRDIDS